MKLCEAKANATNENGSKNFLAAMAVFALIPALLSGCSTSGSSSGANTADAASSTITVSPGSETLAFGSVTQFSATGGSGSYTFSVVGSVDTTSITSSGLFTAPNEAVILLIGAEDTNSNWGYSTITVGSTSSSTGSLGTTPNSLAITALAYNSVQVNCDSTQETYTTGSALCGDGSQPTTEQSGNGMLATCPTSATVGIAANVSCGNSFTSGQTYTRSIWANSVLGLQLFCDVGETATVQTAVCGSGSATPSAVTGGSGQQGYYVNCSDFVAAGLGIACSGTAP